MIVGKAVPRVDAYDKVTGRAKYVDDYFHSDFLVAKVLHSTIANGLVTKIDSMCRTFVSRQRGTRGLPRRHIRILQTASCSTKEYAFTGMILLPLLRKIMWPPNAR